MKAEIMWIIIGVILFFAVVIILGCSGFWGCRYWKQKNSAAKTDKKTKQNVLEKNIAETSVKQDKATEEMVEEKAKTIKDATEENKQSVPAKPKKAKHENC
uniref:Lipoprotein n=1 Tax=Panagrolaimus superbus TaxID=310955 RepID=A0A914Y156_9BILA